MEKILHSGVLAAGKTHCVFGLTCAWPEYFAMRNLFDQYEAPENRLTHALLVSLDEDRNLLDGFVRWATGNKPPVPARQLKILEQGLPGQDELDDPNEAEAKGLPDACIHDEMGWALLIESKIAAPLKNDQLRRHLRTSEKREITDPHLVALVAKHPGFISDNPIVIKKWTDLYRWLRSSNDTSQWRRRLVAYMEVLESKLPKDQYLTGGTLTVFSGIPFGKDYPYNYREAKRIIRLAMDELRLREDLQHGLGVDSSMSGRSAITGREATLVWDFLWLSKAKDAKNFTEFPHLTLGVHREYLHAIVTVPNGLRSDFRRSLLDGGIRDFKNIFEEILARFNKSFGGIQGVLPSVEVIQRRYPTQRSEPFIDAQLGFDLRTAFKNPHNLPKLPKHQPQWLDAAYYSLKSKDSNLQLAVGAKFFYDHYSIVHKPEILDHIASTWLACEPLVRRATRARE